MKEIGGYIQLDDYHLSIMHNEALALNCGRNCLAWLIKTRNIKKIVLPFLLCDSVSKTCKDMGCEIRYYNITSDFLPHIVSIADDEWIYIVNYYGQIQEKRIIEWVQIYQRVIVDNAQAYFDKAVDGVDTIYTCRKFLGVADGAFLYTESDDGYDELPIDISYERMHFLLGRYEVGANPFYSEYVQNNKLFVDEPIKKMSKLTENLLRGIDYTYVKQRRTENYMYLSKRLGNINRLHLLEVDGAFAYPLWVSNASDMRNKLIENKIYVPLLWPNVLDDVETSSLEYDMALNILPLPCDQRYGIKEMDRICEVITQ